MVSRGKLVSEDSARITIGSYDYEYVLRVYYTGTHYNVSTNLYKRSGLFESHPGRNCGDLRRADSEEEIEAVAEETFEDLKEFVQGYHDADELDVSISVN